MNLVVIYLSSSRGLGDGSVDSTPEKKLNTAGTTSYKQQKPPALLEFSLCEVFLVVGMYVVLLFHKANILCTQVIPSQH